MRILTGVVTLVATLAAPAAAVEVHGTPNRDDFVGTAGADVVMLRGGPDRADGRGGPDVLSGGDGRDALDGGGGGDVLSGGAGVDELWPGNGLDVVRAGDGDDYVNVEPDGARDRISCGKGHDIVTLVSELDPLDSFRDCEEFWELVITP